MTEKKNERQFRILPLNHENEVIIAINTSVYQNIVDSGIFVLMKDTQPYKLASLWCSVGEPVVLIWESHDDSVYRPKWDINIQGNDIVSIVKTTKSGSRRTDIKIH